MRIFKILLFGLGLTLLSSCDDSTATILPAATSAPLPTDSSRPLVSSSPDLSQATAQAGTVVAPSGKATNSISFPTSSNSTAEASTTNPVKPVTNSATISTGAGTVLPSNPSPLPSATIPPPLSTATPITVSSPIPVATSNGIQSSYLKGQVVANPACPVVRSDQPCPPRPLANRTIFLKDEGGLTILQTLKTDSNGAFQAQLTPAKYRVEVALVGIETVRHAGPIVVTITASQTTNVVIEVDTGIR